jgi:hypothetical protein
LALLMTNERPLKGVGLVVLLNLGNLIVVGAVRRYWWTQIAGTFSQRPISETGMDRTFAVECAVVVAALIVTILAIEKLRTIASHLPD